MRKRVGQCAETAAWIDQELAGCEFADVRLGKRFKTLVARLLTEHCTRGRALLPIFPPRHNRPLLGSGSGNRAFAP